MEARVKRLTLHVSATGSISQMKLEEIDGSTTEFTFSDMTENIPTDDKDFTFVLPPGVTIVNGTQPI